jgi:hypothetical protein
MIATNNVFAVRFANPNVSQQTRENLSPNTWDVSVELDALPVDVLLTRIVAEGEKRMDLDALTQ